MRKTQLLCYLDGRKGQEIMMKNIRKQAISILLCLVMIIGMIPATSLQAEKRQDTTFYQDYERAFWKGYLPEKYKKQKKTKQVTFEEYRGMLRYVIKQQKGNLKAFDQNVKKANRKLTRGEAIIMSWYAAKALGSSFVGYDPKDVYEHKYFWDSVSEGILKKEFPNVLKAKKVKDDIGNVWDSEFTAAYLWNIWHASVYSEIPVVNYDKTRDMQTLKAFKMNDAVCAVTRMVDGIRANTDISKEKLSYKKNYVKLTDKKATTPTLVLKKKAKVKNIENLPRLTGFVLNAFESEKMICQTPEDIANIANWGFTSARVMINYHMLFDDSVNKVDLNQLEKLDELVAAAEHYGIHLNIMTCHLPGRELWADENYNSGGDFDLFINSKKQDMVCNIWSLLAKRYKDVPGEYISYAPVYEAMNKNLSTGAKAPDYSSKDVRNTMDKIITVMREADKDCFIMCELTAGNEIEHIREESSEDFKILQSKYNNLMVNYNYCEQSYVYAGMTAAEGENIDNNNHSMFLLDYPNKIYSAMNHFSDEDTMEMDGFLPKDTKITLYISKGDGTLKIKTEDQILYEEDFHNDKYETSYLLSRYYPYATSDKKITIRLNEDVSTLSFMCEDGWINWSGMDVTLPKQYAKKKWYMLSAYDRYLQGEGNEIGTYEKRATSNIMICPNDQERGKHLTINKDLTYTSENILFEASGEYSNQWGKEISKFTSNCMIRIECATFSGATESAMEKYYDTLLSMYDKYNFNWYSNDYELITKDSTWKIADPKLVKYGKYEKFNMELLKLLKKHR